MAAYGAYVAKESPNRAGRFCSLAVCLGQYSKDASVPTVDLLKLLGKPDFIAGTTDTGTLVYIYEHPGAANKWAVYASLKDGKLTQVGINDATANDHSAYKPYSTP